LMPHTFMNLSGEALLEWAGPSPPDPTAVLIVCDDIYLPVGRLRLGRSGSAGGPRGLEAIASALQRRDYPRLRVGGGAATSGWGGAGGGGAWGGLARRPASAGGGRGAGGLVAAGRRCRRVLALGRHRAGDESVQREDDPGGERGMTKYETTFILDPGLDDNRV